MESVTATPIARRADELVVGDVIATAFLPIRQSGRVVFVLPYESQRRSWVLVVYRYPDGDPDVDFYLADKQIPLASAADRTGMAYSRADDEPDDPRPVSPARVPLHTGGMTDGGLVDETPAVPDTCNADCACRADPSCQGAPAGFEADCGLVGPHGPHGPEPVA
jgi:hypothetical protein